MYYTYAITNGTRYIKGDNTVNTRIYHIGNGNVNHAICIDYAAVRKIPIGGGGGVTDHAGLLGLLDDDHPQYLRTDGSRQLAGSLDITGALTLGNPDQIRIYHDNDSAHFRTTGGVFIFQTDEGTNTHTYLRVQGKGTGSGFIQVFDEGNYGQFLQAGTVTHFNAVSGSFYLSSASLIRLQPDAAGDVVLFSSSAENITRQLKIYGYRSGDALRSLEIGVGVDEADTASFKGVSNYYFAGNVNIVGALTLGTALAVAEGGTGLTSGYNNSD